MSIFEGVYMLCLRIILEFYRFQLFYKFELNEKVSEDKTLWHVRVQDTTLWRQHFSVLNEDKTLWHIRVKDTTLWRQHFSVLNEDKTLWRLRI
jgi:hypothetical protein